MKPYVNRHKNDAVDAKAICEAAQRTSMRFVAVKTEQQQAAALEFRTRDLAVKQRTQLGNAIRGHLAEYGWVAPKGTAHLAMLADLLEGGEIGKRCPRRHVRCSRWWSTCWPGSTSGSRHWKRRSCVAPARTRWRAG
uniref:IS110 family transposase n=1 Tax=Sphingomonas citri TaxID=2862499 RepID=UPI0027E50C38|nr:transposase [Sphingomonas citri]